MLCQSISFSEIHWPPIRAVCTPLQTVRPPIMCTTVSCALPQARKCATSHASQVTNKGPHNEPHVDRSLPPSEFCDVPPAFIRAPNSACVQGDSELTKIATATHPATRRCPSSNHVINALASTGLFQDGGEQQRTAVPTQWMARTARRKDLCAPQKKGASHRDWRP